MLNLESVTRGADRGDDRDGRMVAGEAASAVPAAGLLGLRAFALAPWVSLSVIALAYAVAEAIRSTQRPADGWLIGSAAALALVAAAIAAVQDRPIGLRYRQALWVYAVGGVATLAVLASFAVRDEGLTSPIFSSVCPLALYMGMVAPPAWRYRALAVLFAATMAVQLAVPADSLFDAVVVWTLIVAAWACGVLVSVGQARTALIIGRMRSVDRPSRTLSRRGFMEALEYAVAPGDRPDQPVALMLLDADLARIAALEGDGGAAALRWIGASVADLLPPSAEFGRLSDGEFGVLITGIGRGPALELGRAVQASMATRVPTTVGVATSETRIVGAPDLFRVADAARAVAAADASGSGVHALVAGSIRSADWDARDAAPARRPRLRFADLRTTGKAPRAVEEAVMNRRIGTLSTFALVVAGAPIVVRGLLDDGSGLAVDVVRYVGVPWLVWVGLTTAATYRWATGTNVRAEHILFACTSGALAGGVTAVALAEGGLTSPIAAVFFLKVLFDATVFDRGRSLFGLGLVLTGWAVVTALGPAASLWVVPFHLALFAGCFALGRLGRGAMDDTAELARDRARRDDLTGLATRPAFAEQAELAFFESATTTGQPFALISLRIEGMRDFNEARGYAAGDALLQHVAGLLHDRIGAYYALGRTGGTEFSAAVMAGEHAADGLARDLEETIGALARVRVACAACPRDGATVPALMLAADRVVGAPRTRVV